MGSHSLPQRLFPTQGSDLTLLHCLCLVIIKMFGSSRSVSPPQGVAQVIVRSHVWHVQFSRGPRLLRSRKRTKRCDSGMGQLSSPFRCPSLLPSHDLHPCRLQVHLLLRMLRCINHGALQVATLPFLFAAVRKEMLQRTAAMKHCLHAF